MNFFVASISILLLLAGSFAPRQTHASEDFSMDTPGWNTYSIFAGIARGMHLEVNAPKTLDWEDVTPKDALFILSPEPTIKARELLGFVHQGGQLMIADELGKNEELLSHLGVQLSPEPFLNKDNETSHLGFEVAPIAQASSSRHPLAQGINKLVANHARAFTRTHGAQNIFLFDEGSVLVTTGDFGAGSYTLIADSSILIDRMLELEGNLRFGQNLISALTLKGITRLYVLKGNTTFTGQPFILPQGAVISTGRFRAKNKLNHNLSLLKNYLVTKVNARRLSALFLGMLVVTLWFLLTAHVKKSTSVHAKPPDTKFRSDQLDVIRNGLWIRLFVKFKHHQLTDTLDAFNGLSTSQLNQHIERLLGPNFLKLFNSLPRHLFALNPSTQSATIAKHPPSSKENIRMQTTTIHKLHLILDSQT